MSVPVRQQGPSLGGKFGAFVLDEPGRWYLADVCESADLAENVIRYELGSRYQGHGLIARFTGQAFSSAFDKKQAEEWAENPE